MHKSGFKSEKALENKKKKIQKRLNLINNGLLEVILSIFLLIGIIALMLFLNINPMENFDISFFITIIFTYALNTIVKVIIKQINKKHEDELKLDTNYKKIAKRYSNQLLEYGNLKTTPKNLKLLIDIDPDGYQQYIDKCENSKTPKGFPYRFPIIQDYYLKNVKIQIDDNQSMYKLPEEMSNQFDYLFKAHSASNIYNQLNIRVDYWTKEKNTFTMHTSRTMYYYSLVTNRSMDYTWENGITNRELFECGPFLMDLKDSKLSNHIGFNGFIVSKDDYVVFVVRNNSVSIGKGTLGNSVSASLKAKYALNQDYSFTLAGLRNAIIKEIYDELKINEENLETIILEKNLICAYRDIVEGGKPQLLFWAKSTLSKDEITEHFKNEINKKKKITKSRWWDKESKEAEDGETLIWINKDELQHLGISPHCITYNGKVYTTMPSSSAAVAMYIQYLNDSEN